MSMHEFAESLNLRDRHLCCDDAEYYLFPPRKGGTYGNAIFFSIGTWYIDLGDGGTLIRVYFCPFCGKRLEAEQ